VSKSPGDKNIERLFILVERLIGEDARKVFEVMYEEGDEIAEHEIIERSGLKGSSVRRALNILAEKGFVTYRKVKHPDKGRIIFYWRINYEGLPSVIRARRVATLEKLKALLEAESETQYYICPLDGTRYTFDEALDHEFNCPRCGSMLVPDEDRELRLQILRQYVRMLEADTRGNGARSS
jgi:transcription initiation factor TFIIE subunit alpha